MALVRSIPCVCPVLRKPSEIGLFVVEIATSSYIRRNTLPMKTLIAVAGLFFSTLPLTAQWSGNMTPTYPELIAYYQKLDREHSEIELYAMGGSDTDWPIYVCIINGAQDSVRTFQKARENTTVLINNAIHPGEPDGVNACLIWIDNWIKNGKKIKDLPVIAIIPAYNVGGMFNRSSTSRANQDGPEEYGFRGNSQNLDLNRDFIKMDSPNAATFATIWQLLNPDVFVDTHVSNGADYQYTLTYIPSMKERLAPSIRRLTYDQCIPWMTMKLKQHKTELFPYVELKEETPEEGITAFNDLPRYAMGYATLFHALSFTLETHMLKPFPQRVAATQLFIDNLFRWTQSSAGTIEAARREAVQWSLAQTHYRYNYRLSEKADSVRFSGFQAIHRPSPVTGLERLYYDRKQPYSKRVPYFGTYEAKDSVAIPKAYVLGGSNEAIIRRLELNGVGFNRLDHDTIILLTTVRVLGYESPKQPYEGHYLHNKILMGEETDSVRLLKGALIIPTNQERRQFLLAVMEPAAEDSYFAWNFFDSHLQQKEYFSSYVFEEKAAELLAGDPVLATDFQEKKRTDPAFAASAWDQLFFIYKRSPYFERTTVNRLPLYKLF
jgi:hypothetical protein